MQRAEAVMDKTERKLEKNHGKVKVIKERGVRLIISTCKAWLTRL